MLYEIDCIPLSCCTDSIHTSRRWNDKVKVLLYVTLETTFWTDREGKNWKINLWKSSHVAPTDVRVWTVEFLNDREALIQLSEHVSDRAREQGVLRGVLKLIQYTRPLCVVYMVAQKLHNEMCSRYLSTRINRQCRAHKTVQVHSETVFSVSSLLPDDTFQPVTPLIDGAVSEALRQFAPLRDDCTLELLDCSESSPTYL